MFPLCETTIPAPVAGEPMNWGTETTASFRVRICIVRLCRFLDFVALSVSLT